MTDITNSDDIIDIRDVIARFEELEAQRKPWIAGWNMPGYMPDSEPAGFSDFDDAITYITDQMREELESLEDGDDAAIDLQAAIDRYEDATEGEHGETVGKWHYFVSRADGVDAFDDKGDADEYQALKDLLDECRGIGGDEQWRGDWYPVSLVRDSYFKEYAQELAEDIGAVNAGATWPNNCIDWDQAARELRIDYTSVEFDGVTYWTR